MDRKTLFIGYLDNSLTPAQSREVEQLLTTDGNARSEMDALRARFNAIKKYSPEPANNSSEVNDFYVSQLMEVRKKIEKQPATLQIPFRAGLTFAATLIAVLFFTLPQMNTSETPITVSEVRVFEEVAAPSMLTFENEVSYSSTVDAVALQESLPEINNLIAEHLGADAVKEAAYHSEYSSAQDLLAELSDEEIVLLADNLEIQQ